MMCHTDSSITIAATRPPGVAALLCLLALCLFGCDSQPTIFKNPDPALQKSNSEWRADAAGHLPYKTDVPHQREARARAQVAYVLNRLEVVNFSDEDWKDVEVWVNRQYVCFIPCMQSRQLKEIHFPMLYDANGATFPMHGKNNLIQTVELYRNGVMYQIICHNGDY